MSERMALESRELFLYGRLVALLQGGDAFDELMVAWRRTAAVQPDREEARRPLHAPRYGQTRAGHRTGVVRQQEGDHRGKLIRRNPARRIGVRHGRTIRRRIDDAGQHRIDGDVPVFQFFRERFGEPRDARFRRRVRTHARTRFLGRQCADVHDACALLAQQIGQDFMRSNRRSAHVHRVEAIPRFNAARFQRFPCKTTRDVDQRIDTAEPPGDLPKRIRGVGCIAKIDVAEYRFDSVDRHACSAIHQRDARTARAQFGADPAP
ncbi:hypothetical protein KCU90_g623, partial [Aureobasidium melanogenum]